MSLRKSLGLFYILLSLQARAETSTTLFTMQAEEQNSRVSLTAELGSLSLGSATLETQGASLQYDYSVIPLLSLEGFLSTAFSSGDTGVQSSFFGFGAYAMVNIVGNCCLQRQSYFVNSKPVLTERAESTWNLMVGPGIDQYLLTGSKGVYSTSGYGVQGSLIFPVWGYWGRVNVKYSNLTASGQEVGAMFVGAGMQLNF